jgi:uncharacterized protein YjbI with pentapeptide repeats
MIAIAIILISIASLLLGVFHDHKAARARKSFFGLTRLGMSLVALSVVGLALGIAKQLSDVKQKNKNTRLCWAASGNRSLMSRTIELQTCRTTISAIPILTEVTFHCASFRDSLFRDADLAGAVFQNANLSGADLSTAVIDKNTILPKTPPR